MMRFRPDMSPLPWRRVLAVALLLAGAVALIGVCVLGLWVSGAL